jgi:hypothetical protein
MAVVRAAIAAELAANLAIRAHYATGAQHSAEQVDVMLREANGLRGKFQRHLLRFSQGTPKHVAMRELNDLCMLLNDERNSICHSGSFKSKASARRTVALAHKIIMTLVPEHEDEFNINSL